jgi:hypothetical protein
MRFNKWQYFQSLLGYEFILKRAYKVLLGLEEDEENYNLTCSLIDMMIGF